MTLLDILPSLRAAVTPRLDPTLWPHTTRIDQAGRLTIGGVALADIADEVGTPACVIDEADFRYRARRYRKELPGTKVVYAGQALLTTAVARWAAEEHLGVDVCSAGGLASALSGGVHPSRIVYHGNTHDGLRAAVAAGVGRIVVGSLEAIVSLAHLARAPRHVLVRVNLDADGHDRELVALIMAEPMLRLVGLHCHLGSQVTNAERYGEAIRRMVGTMADVRRAHGLVLGELNIGGGHGVPYVFGDRGLALRHLAAEALDALDSGCADERFPRPTLVVEPGRAMAARAGVTLYRVLAVETRPDGRMVVALDGNLSGPAQCTATPANRHAPGPSQRMSVVGHSGATRDVDLPADIHPGDLLAMACTGAYCSSDTLPLIAVHNRQLLNLR